MKLTLENRHSNWIRGYETGEVRVGDQHIRHNCLISAERISPWDISREIELGNIKSILDLNPEVVILGLRDMQHLPAASIYAAFLERGIGLEVMDIGAACRTFNIMLGEDRRVVAAFKLKAD